MKFECLRSGMCCINPVVMIVHNVELADRIGVDYDGEHDREIENNLITKESGQRCPYLVGEIGRTSCQLHNKWWYKDTPCFNHTQLGGGKCRTGEFLIDTPSSKEMAEQLKPK